MSVSGQDINQTLEYRTATAIVRQLPTGLLLVFFGLVIFALVRAAAPLHARPGCGILRSRGHRLMAWKPKYPDPPSSISLWSRVRRMKSRMAGAGTQHAKVAIPSALIGAALCWTLLSFITWHPLQVLKHVAAFPNCSFARAVGVAPSYRGRPGYWPKHDADNDGISCEIWPRR